MRVFLSKWCQKNRGLNFQIWVFNDPFNQIIKKYIIIKLYNAMMTFLTIYHFRKIIN